jgi:hypothetical protein
MNSDLGGWNVEKVTTMVKTFNSASKFVGTGLSKWKTASVTSLQNTFDGAGAMNSDLSSWKVGKVTMLKSTFQYASKFTGGGLHLWDVGAVTIMDHAFGSTCETTALVDCTRIAIADADVWKTNAAFIATDYDTDWAALTCSSAKCPQGEGLPVSSTTCSTCAPGQYSATTDYTPCRACIRGKYSTAAAGQTSEATCIACVEGKYSTAAAGQARSESTRHTRT